MKCPPPAVLGAVYMHATLERLDVVLHSLLNRNCHAPTGKPMAGLFLCSLPSKAQSDRERCKPRILEGGSEFPSRERRYAAGCRSGSYRPGDHKMLAPTPN